MAIRTDDLEAGLAWAVAAFNTNQNKRYGVYRSYLDGNHPLAFATEKFREAFGGMFDEFAYNLCETVVDAHAERMEVAGFASDAEELAQAANDLWDMNDMDDREGQVEAEQFGMGDAYVIVDAVDNQPVIWPQIASEVRVRYSWDRPGHRDLAARLWSEPGGPWRLNLYTPQAIARYAAPRKDGSTDIPKKPEAFSPYRVQGDPWPLPAAIEGVVPVFHFPNNARVNEYGVSELQHVIPLQNALNKTVLDKMIAMEFAAFPQRVILGLEIDPDDPKAKEMLQRFEAGVQRLMWLKGAEGDQVSLDEFSAADIRQYLDAEQRFEQMISTVSKVPKNYLGLRTTEYASGESKRMDETQFVKKIEKRQAAAGAVWSQVMEYALALAGKSVQPGELRVNWKSPAPISEEERIARVLNKRAAGYAFVTALREEGYDPDQVAIAVQERAEEQEAMDQRFNAGSIVPFTRGVS